MFLIVLHYKEYATTKLLDLIKLYVWKEHGEAHDSMKVEALFRQQTLHKATN